MAIVKLKRSAELAPQASPEVRTLNDTLVLAKNLDLDGPPCSVEGIAKTLGIRIVYEPMDQEMSGFLERRMDGWVAGINSYHHHVRQRFTLAHEIAHFVLHRDHQNEFKDQTFARRKSDPNAMERQADSFAANLLMPESAVRSAIDRGLRNLNDLALQFEVSSLAMRFRLESLGYRLT
ncbi:TPA: ImmA/IrrE family metallo-endopeptidase [Stenotrophomonas maltophilia]|uniref:ImmA/IrrE family metallo-endopeptidase n=1 Tax=Stenotrophomonas maltophilia TaxID=40324 RepID=UPI0018D362CC|nr:ImmA/IrrE family metallo-endopeptidase [Stenotrophomonas maltophilia]HDS1650390.1 ImmA/IrrE family metallo-endopeptidase [Stenotrophomonas maltophilia]